VLKIKTFIYLLIFLSFSAVSSISADTLTDLDKSKIKSVVEKQLQAFAEDDFEEAYSYAAPLIKQIFSSVEVFKNMVTTQYQAVYRPKKIDFGDVKIIKGAPTLNVFLVDPDGNFVTATYLMQQQPDLSWLISGCYLKTSDFEQI
jgi:sensor domain CHASE-containing protein